MAHVHKKKGRSDVKKTRKQIETIYYNVSDCI